MNRAASQVVAFGLALVPALSAAQDTGKVEDVLRQAPPLLKRAVEVADSLVYSGTRVVEYRRGPDRVRFKEFVLKSAKNSRTEFPSDSEFAGQVIVDTPKGRQHYYPDSNEIRLSPPRREYAVMRLVMVVRRMGKSVKFESHPGGQVAARPAGKVLVKDASGNVVQRLWIDEGKALVLKREVLDKVGTVVASFEFSSINFSPRISPSDFEIRRAGATTVTPRDVALRLARENDMQPVTLPASTGYELEFSRMMELGSRRVYAQFYRSESGATVSLFQFKGAVDPGDDRRRRGHKSYSWQAQGRTFTLVGRLSESELKALARSLA